MVSALANHQAKRASVCVLYSKRPETPSDLTLLFDQGVFLEHLQMSSTREGLSSVSKLRSKIKNYKPDAIYLHSSKAGFLGRLSALGLGIKVFYIPHCISFIRTDLKCYAREIFVLLEKVANRINRSTYLACSRSEYEEIRRRLPEANCKLVENGFELKGQSSDKASDFQEKCRVVTVAQIRAQKNPSLFALIARLVRERHPGIEFFWIGDGNEERKKELEDAGVQVTGWLGREQVFERLSSATVYLSTSSWEGLPVSVLEAMSLGCLVIATRCPGNVDVIADDFSGYLFDNPDQAALLISDAVNNPQGASRLIVNAKKEIFSRFSLHRYFVDMDEALEEALQR